MKNNEKLPVEVREVREYVVRPAANGDGEIPYLYAQVDRQFWTSQDKPESTKLPKMEIEAYTGPEDFCKQLTEGLRMHMDDELVDHRLFDSMKITLVIEYVQVREKLS